MKQEINFYQEQFYESKTVFSFLQMQTVLIGFAVIMAGVSALLFVLNSQSETELAQLREKENAISASISSLTEIIAKQSVDQDLLEAVTFSNWQILAKQEVLKLISEKDKRDPNLFSNLLIGLARQHVKGLWLSKINIDKGGHHIFLQGSALQAALIPTLIDQLKAEPVFIGRQFKTVFLERENAADNKIDFVLNTSMLNEDIALLSGMNR